MLKVLAEFLDSPLAKRLSSILTLAATVMIATTPENTIAHKVAIVVVGAGATHGINSTGASSQTGQADGG